MSSNLSAIFDIDNITTDPVCHGLATAPTLIVGITSCMLTSEEVHSQCTKVTQDTRNGNL